MQTIQLIRLGRTTYPHALQVQRAVHAHCVRTGRDIVLLTEHEPVITLGYRRLPEQVRVAPEALAARGIAVMETERGGGATYHGPGQLVAYPLFSSLLRRFGVRGVVAGLEEAMCRASHTCGVPAERRAGLPGAWVGKRKLGAVGLAVRRGVSLHGCALNVNLDLHPFSYIIPCGLSGTVVTSLARELGIAVSMAVVEASFLQEFAAVFTATWEERPNEWGRIERETLACPLDYYQSS